MSAAAVGGWLAWNRFQGSWKMLRQLRGDQSSVIPQIPWKGLQSACRPCPFCSLCCAQLPAVPWAARRALLPYGLGMVPCDDASLPEVPHSQIAVTSRSAPSTRHFTLYVCQGQLLPSSALMCKIHLQATACEMPLPWW